MPGTTRTCYSRSNSTLIRPQLEGFVGTGVLRSMATPRGFEPLLSARNLYPKYKKPFHALAERPRKVEWCAVRLAASDGHDSSNKSIRLVAVRCPDLTALTLATKATS